jgi:hypothetical protein
MRESNGQFGICPVWLLRIMALPFAGKELLLEIGQKPVSSLLVRFEFSA